MNRTVSMSRFAEPGTSAFDCKPEPQEQPGREDDEKPSTLPKFIGWQELPQALGGGRMATFNLVAKLGEHPVGSTVYDRTLLQHGYDVLQLAAIIKTTGLQ